MIFISKIIKSMKYNTGYTGGDVIINNFNLSLNRGIEGEKNFVNLIKENSRIEVKYERHQFVMTGNIFIEFQQKTKYTKRWIDSGILKDYDTLAYGLEHPIIGVPIFILLSRESIIKLLKWGKDNLNLEVKEKSNDDGTNITRGILFPLSKLLWSEELLNQYEEKKELETKQRLREVFKKLKNKK